MHVNNIELSNGRSSVNVRSFYYDYYLFRALSYYCRRRSTVIKKKKLCVPQKKLQYHHSGEVFTLGHDQQPSLNSLSLCTSCLCSKFVYTFNARQTKIVSNTHFCDGTLVRLKKLLRTLRRLASICANGVTMRSSPWLEL